jgi:hypothetical protein
MFKEAFHSVSLLPMRTLHGAAGVKLTCIIYHSTLRTSSLFLDQYYLSIFTQEREVWASLLWLVTVTAFNGSDTHFQLATLAFLVALAAVCAYPYPGYGAEGLEGHGLSLEGHGLELEGAGGLEGHAISAYGGHGGETEHEVDYYVSILVWFCFEMNATCKGGESWVDIPQVEMTGSIS